MPSLIKNSNSSNIRGGSGIKAFINSLLEYDAFIVFGGFGMVILTAIMISVLYEEADNMRHNVLFNNAMAILMGFLFIYLIFTFMGQNITIFQVKIDLGLLLFLTLGIVIVFVLGD